MKKKNKIITVPLEDIESRYTVMMNDELRNISDIFIYPTIEDMDDKISSGQFLDINKTILFKSSQMREISRLFLNRKISDGDIFFVSDLFFPGIESIKYMAELQNLDVKIYGINHAGRADRNDFVQKLSEWSDYSELGYHLICDKIFVGSHHHKKNILSHPLFKQKINEEKIIVTGQIWNPEWVIKRYDIDIENILNNKKRYIIWPHRFTEEKGIDELYKIANKIDIDIYITSGNSINHKDKSKFEKLNNVYFFENINKKQYYDIFSNAEYYMNNSYQETFGYTIQEAILFKTKIVCANRACIPEMVPSINLYNDVDEIPILLLKDDELIIKNDNINQKNNLKKMMNEFIKD